MDFQELLGKCGVSHKRERDGWVNFRCVLCGKDPYLGYNLAGRYCNCWSCGPVSLREVVRFISGLSGASLAEVLDGLPQERLKSLKKCGAYREPEGVSPLHVSHWDYLIGRKFCPAELTKLWQICGIGIDGGLNKWRLFIPILLRGERVSWTTRALGDRRPRYLSAKDEESSVSVKDLLYGVDYVRNSVVVVEGPLDVWAVGPGAVATMGLGCSPAQLDQLSRFPIRTLCFDSEPEAQDRAGRLARDLQAFGGVTRVIQLESGKDAAAADKEEIKQLRKEFLL